MRLYLVRERIPYEGENYWVMSADSEEQVKLYFDNLPSYENKPDFWNAEIEILSNISDYDEIKMIFHN